MSGASYLSDITESVCSRFKAARSILSFDEFIEQVRDKPRVFCRSSAQYLHDAMRHFGTYKVKTPYGTETRYRMFDHESEEHERWVVGQEQAQQAIFRMLGNFVEEGRNTRLLLLHGPNGSGKSSLVQTLIRGLEEYSRTDEGALYQFNWIFPAEKLKRSGIGFSSEAPKADSSELHSYAHLEGDQIEARIPNFLKDSPLLLLPHPERKALFQSLYESGALPTAFKVSDALMQGDLEPRSRMIFDALLAHHGGDFAEVLRHIQVERFYISQRYRKGGVTVEPQMHVDASVRQVSADRSLASLPKPLNNLNLFEAFGAVVDANRGILEFSDLLKRPFEAFKYLLGTSETGRVNVEPVILFLDLLFIGNANELNLDRFKEVSEFSSFKSRIELIKVPYILRFSLEQQIYDHQLAQRAVGKPIVPHLTYLASLWAVMTRFKRPNPERLPDSIASLVTELTPLEKAHLYNDGTIPKRFSVEQAKYLRQSLRELFFESVNDTHYEGRIGASPREIRSVLLNAAQNEEYPCVSPLALFDEFEKLVQQKSVYEFLQLEPRDGYYDPEGFIDVIREEHLRLIDKDFHTAAGLVQADQHSQQLKRYIRHVKAYIQKEKVFNPITQAHEDPDKKLMGRIEDVLLSEDDDTDSFRQGLISKIAVFSLDHPGEEVDVVSLFKDYIEILEKDFFKRQQKRLSRIAQHCLVLLHDDKNSLSDADKEEAQQAIDYMQETLGYPRESLQETIALLLRKRLQGDEK